MQSNTVFSHRELRCYSLRVALYRSNKFDQHVADRERMVHMQNNRTGLRGLLQPFVLTLCIVGVCTAADSPLRFRNGWLQQNGISAISAAEKPKKFTFTANVDATGKLTVLDHHAVSSIGGIILVEKAQRSVPTIGDCPALAYDPAQPNGARLMVDLGHFGKKPGQIFDWELVPTANFVKSGNHGLFTYMKNYAEYHPAFAGNLAGVNLYFVDTTRNLKEFSDIHRGFTINNIPGYPSTPSTDANRAASMLLKSELGQEQLMYTDKGVKFLFSAGRDHFEISGTPYWIVIGTDQNGHGRILKRIDPTLPEKANPVVYGSVIRIAKYTAFFRHMKEDCSEQWTSFQRALEAQRARIDVYSAAEVPHQVHGLAVM